MIDNEAMVINMRSQEAMAYINPEAELTCLQEQKRVMAAKINPQSYPRTKLTESCRNCILMRRGELTRLDYVPVRM